MVVRFLGDAARTSFLIVAALEPRLLYTIPGGEGVLVDIVSQD